LAALSELLRCRAAAYETAHVTIDTDHLSVDETVQAVCEVWHHFQRSASRQEER